MCRIFSSYFKKCFSIKKKEKKIWYPSEQRHSKYYFQAVVRLCIAESLAPFFLIGITYLPKKKEKYKEKEIEEKYEFIITTVLDFITGVY